MEIQMLFIGTVVLFLGAVIYAAVTSFEKKEVTEIPRPISFKTGQEALDFLDRVIKEKYKFYMYTELYPIYLNNKIPEKTVVQEVKEKIYVSVVGSLSKQVKKEILNFFTERGIEIYTNEKIIILMNETDFSASNLNGNFRDLKPYQVDTIMP